MLAFNPPLSEDGLRRVYGPSGTLYLSCICMFLIVFITSIVNNYFIVSNNNYCYCLLLFHLYQWSWKYQYLEIRYRYKINFFHCIFIQAFQSCWWASAEQQQTFLSIIWFTYIFNMNTFLHLLGVLAFFTLTQRLSAKNLDSNPEWSDIIGGEAIEQENSLPMLVTININLTTKVELLGSGFILNKDWILTVGHLFYQFEEE